MMISSVFSNSNTQTNTITMLEQHALACRHCLGQSVPDQAKVPYLAALLGIQDLRAQIEHIESQNKPMPFVCFMCSAPSCLRYSVLSYEFHKATTETKQTYATAAEYYCSLLARAGS